MSSEELHSMLICEDMSISEDVSQMEPVSAMTVQRNGGMVTITSVISQIETSLDLTLGKHRCMVKILITPLMFLVEENLV